MSVRDQIRAWWEQNHRLWLRGSGRLMLVEARDACRADFKRRGIYLTVQEAHNEIYELALESELATY